tara:strand:- start:128 stop:1033 length:906 start_codon:yes stop_codon:yes gene_type:complete
MKLPKISIVTPSFNNVKYIEMTINSIIDQDYPNLEYIVIDGGSDDGTKNIIEKYDDKISFWQSSPDKGQSDAINKGFKKSTGDIITFCNSDDIYLPGTFNYVAEKWEYWKKFGAIIGSFQYMDENSKIIDKPRKSKISQNGPVDLSLGPPGNYRLHQVSTFFSSNALDKVGRYVKEDFHFVLDRELLFRVLKEFPIYLVDRSLGVFRIHSDSKSTKKIIPFYREFHNLYMSMLNGNKEEDSLRRYMARYYLFRGNVKKAKSENKLYPKMQLFIKSIFILPEKILEINYLKLWLKIIFKSSS